MCQQNWGFQRAVNPDCTCHGCKPVNSVHAIPDRSPVGCGRQPLTSWQKLQSPAARTEELGRSVGRQIKRISRRGCQKRPELLCTEKLPNMKGRYEQCQILPQGTALSACAVPVAAQTTIHHQRSSQFACLSATVQMTKTVGHLSA